MVKNILIHPVLIESIEIIAFAYLLISIIIKQHCRELSKKTQILFLIVISFQLIDAVFNPTSYFSWISRIILLLIIVFIIALNYYLISPYKDVFYYK